MKTSVKLAIVTVVLGVIFFLLEPNGPLGGFWAPAPDSNEASGVQVPLFILLGLIEAFISSFGVAFLIFGFPLVKAVNGVSKTLTRATHLAISWALLSWWSHGSLHVHNGDNLDGLLAIEYGYHVTLVIAASIIAYYFCVTVLLRQAAPAQAQEGAGASATGQGGRPKAQPEGARSASA